MRTGRPKKPLNMPWVRRLYARGLTVRVIGHRVGLCHTTISRRLAEEWRSLGLPSARAYRTHLISQRRASKQEVLVQRTDRGTRYVVVGRRVHVERRT